MASPILNSSNNVIPDLVAQEPKHRTGPSDSSVHPLAAEEWLVSHVFAALADPRAVCEFALVNRNFCSASKSNLVWQKLLPPPSHLESLFKECEDKSLQNWTSPSKRDVYFHLCKSISLDGGLKKFWLDQRTGGECYMLSARTLAIAWGSTPQYWEWLPCPGAWFREVAVLRSVCWFDIGGKFRQLLKPGSYVVSFRMQVRSAYSWRWEPINLSLQNMTYAQPPVKSRTYFHRQFPISNPPITSPLTLREGQPSANDPEHSDSHHPVWVECDVGKFDVEENEDGPVEVAFSMREVEVLGWKTGFLLDGVLIRPSDVVEARDKLGSMHGFNDGDDEEMSAVEDGFTEDTDGEDNDNDNDDDDDESADVEDLNDMDDDDDDGSRGRRNCSD